MKYYGGKHYESIYTRFFQGYILPNKFGYDKRRSHLSSLVCSGEITREQAMEELLKNTYDPVMQQNDYDYVIKKLEISENEFKSIMNNPKKSYWDYPNYGVIERRKIYQKLRQIYLNRKKIVT